MGYSIRSLATLADLARQTFAQSVSGAVVRLWANTFTVFGKVFALLDFEHEQRRAYLYEQIFASTAAPQWLARHGFELGLTQDPGDVAVGSLSTTVPGGTLVPASLSYSRADGRTYTTLAPVTAPGSATQTVSIVLPVSADLAGADGDMSAGDTLTLVNSGSGPFGLAASATVTAPGLTGGADAEDVETFRARVLYRKRNPPQGGSAPDYVKWVGEALSTLGTDASGVEVYVDSFANDSRAVWVCFRVSDQPDGIPNDAQVATVQAYIDDPVRRPVTARAFAVKPAAVPQAIGIRNLSTDTPDVRAAITAELAAFFADEVQPSTPSSPGPFVLYVEAISAAVARAAGVGTFTLVTPSADQTFSVGGQLPTLGTIGFS